MNLLAFHLAYNRDQDGYQFISFLPQWREFVLWHNLGLDKQFEPVSGFVQFLQGAFNPADKICVRLGALRFPIMRANRFILPTSAFIL